MSKNNFILFILTVFLVLASPANAQNATGSASIGDLKDRLATKVAEMKQLVRKAVWGTVKTISAASITVETSAKELKIDLTDDIVITQLIKNKRTTLSADDIDKGDTVAIIGNYDGTLDVLEATHIVIQNNMPVRVSGILTDIDKKAYTFTIKTSDGQSYIVDYEKSTTTSEFNNAETKTEKAGFSDITDNDVVSVLGFPVPNKENRISAARILLIHTDTQSPSPTPSIEP